MNKPATPITFINLTDANSGYLVRLRRNGKTVPVMFRRIGFSTDSVMLGKHDPEIAEFARAQLDAFLASGL
jgi:hypothetical protein